MKMFGQMMLFCGMAFCSATTEIKADSYKLDRQLGAENAQMVASEMGIYQDNALTAYVNQVGQRLVAQLEEPMFDFKFYVADDPTPNAFDLPGGYIYVTRGILTLINSEDELACVLGHEIIHAPERHAIKQMKKYYSSFVRNSRQYCRRFG